MAHLNERAPHTFSLPIAADILMTRPDQNNSSQQVDTIGLVSEDDPANIQLVLKEGDEVQIYDFPTNHTYAALIVPNFIASTPNGEVSSSIDDAGDCLVFTIPKAELTLSIPAADAHTLIDVAKGYTPEELVGDYFLHRVHQVVQDILDQADTPPKIG